jgi:hypothetical protein
MKHLIYKQEIAGINKENAMEDIVREQHIKRKTLTPPPQQQEAQRQEAQKKLTSTRRSAEKARRMRTTNGPSLIYNVKDTEVSAAAKSLQDRRIVWMNDCA